MRFVPVPNGVKVFDNNGETFDRYTVQFPDGATYSMSEKPFEPNGICRFIGEDASFPNEVRRHIAPTQVVAKIYHNLV